jgi:CBS domain-containing protein
MTDTLTVNEIMTPDPVALRRGDTLQKAAREMALGAIRHLPVVDPAGYLIGLVTHRDVLRAGAEGTAGDIMTTDVLTVAPDTSACEAAYLLLRHKIGCVPVTDATGALRGIVTESDFVRAAYTLLGGAVPVDQLELEEEEAGRV